MIVVSGRARIRSGERETALREARAVAAASRKEVGCMTYEFSIDVEDENVVRIFEEWESQAALDAHFQTPHLQAFGAVAARVLEGGPSMTRYVVESAGPLG
jgi:quinol monooxygenase YgiN